MKRVMAICWQHKGNLLQRYWRILPLASMLALTACNSMPYKIVRTDNAPAPVCPYQPLMIGSIQADRYNATAGYGNIHPAFSVAVPQSVMIANPTCRPISDGEDSDGRYVIFGPTASDRTIYRLNVGALSAKDHPFFNFSEKAMAESVQTMVNHYHAPVTKLYERYYVYHGHSTRFAVYQQQLDGHGGSGSIAKGGETLTQMVYVIKQHQHYAVLWVTASSCSKKNWVNGSNRMSVLQHRWAPVKQILDSLSMPHATGASGSHSHVVTVNSSSQSQHQQSPLPAPLPSHNHYADISVYNAAHSDESVPPMSASVDDSTVNVNTGVGGNSSIHLN
ncbi:MAG: hypothetical protein GY782_00145 [Gammaproteobacteria bacterium]|nr:hypothetical protein [Gammaproteobacteria bacterium]